MLMPNAKTQLAERKATSSTQTAPTAPWTIRVMGSGIQGLFWKAMTKVSR